MLNEKLMPSVPPSASSNGAANDYNRQTTFADGMARKSTFSRAFTFDGAYIREGLAQPLAGITRTLTEVGNRFDPDAKFTKEVVKQYNIVSEEGNSGDIPFPDGFLGTSGFLKVMFFVCLVSCIMGVVAAGFMNFVDQIPKQWDDCDYGQDSSCGDFYNGQLYWVWITTGGGFCVGLIRWAFYYPTNLPGLFADVQNFHVDPKWIIFTFTLSAISLGCGATLGPEQALGNMGGGLAYFISQFVKYEDDDYRKLTVLAGMAAPLGALFPSPMLGALMMHEMGEPPKHFMLSTVILSVASVLCFAIYYEMIGVTFLEYQGVAQVVLAAEWLEYGYDNWQIGTAVVIGMVSAVLCVCVLVTVGVTKQIFFRIRDKFAVTNPFLSEILPPTIGGLCIGLVNYALPATVGNGSMMLTFFIKYGASTDPDSMSKSLLLSTGFGRMFLLGVSMNCGFVGGIIFPFITMGTIAGAYMFKFYSWMPKLLCIATFMVALPCGIVPLPFTFACLSVFIFYLGVYQTVPIFVACMVSYTLVSGSGLLKFLINRGDQAKKEEADGGAATNAKEEKAKAAAAKEAEDYALATYLGNKKAGNSGAISPIHH